jgi:hypothetical protein
MPAPQPVYSVLSRGTFLQRSAHDAQPQRDVRRLQALVDDAAQLVAERVELDLVAQPRAETSDGLLAS